MRAEAARAVAAFDTVFRSFDPFDQPFVPLVARRLILFPVDYVLEGETLAAVISGVAALGEAQAFMSLVEGCEDGTFDRQDHWLVDLEPGMYASLGKEGFFPLMENALYSVAGTWGILFSHEQHALLGGPPPLVDAVAARLSSPEGGVREFLHMWKDNRDRLRSPVDWLPPLLEHIYGVDAARRLLEAVGW